MLEKTEQAQITLFNPSGFNLVCLLLEGRNKQKQQKKQTHNCYVIVNQNDKFQSKSHHNIRKSIMEMCSVQWKAFKAVLMNLPP